jgi:lipopolysaccharide export system permease protein
MLKNKIYKYFFNEILKNFITILLTFTAIAWVVRAVNFLDLMVVDGYGVTTYFKYTLLNITTIMSRFIPLAFLISLTVSIAKFERQQEFLILWTTGLAKINLVNLFLMIGFFITILQLILSLIINPLLLNKSRFILSNTDPLKINAVLKSNDFSDAFQGMTFYIQKKNINNELINIFIKDTSGSLNTIVNEVEGNKNSTIVAEKGFLTNGKIILFNGLIQTLNEKKEINNIQFEKTELSLNNITTRTIKKAKIQETSSLVLVACIFDLNINLKLINCSKHFNSEAVQVISRRLGAPLYIPLISILTSFLLIYKKEKNFSFLKKYLLFILSFSILVISEILLKFTSLSFLATIIYFVIPIIMGLFFYIFLFNSIRKEKIIK